MKDGLFQYFCSTTAGFVFSTRQNVIPASITGTPHEREVKALINDVRRMAVKKSMQLPETFSADCDRDDWIQLAMITMFKCCEKYDRKRPFDNFVRFMVSKKMADNHRSLLRKNPPADREVLYLYHEMKKLQGNEADLVELAHDTRKSVEQLLKIIEVGVGIRTFTSELTTGDEKTSREIASKKRTPEEKTADKEIRHILLQCMNKLSGKARYLFQQHEIEEISFKKLFEQVCYKKSFASFKRWYKIEIFDLVQQCVLSQTY